MKTIRNFAFIMVTILFLFSSIELISKPKYEIIKIVKSIEDGHIFHHIYVDSNLDGYADVCFVMKDLKPHNWYYVYYCKTSSIELQEKNDLKFKILNNELTLTSQNSGEIENFDNTQLIISDYLGNFRESIDLIKGVTTYKLKNQFQCGIYFTCITNGSSIFNTSKIVIIN